MKKITLSIILLFGLFGFSQTITHSNSLELGNTNIACNNAQITSSDNRYFRFFELSTFSITEDYTISSVQFGVSNLTIPTLPDGFPVTVKVYATPNTNFPTGYPTGYTELAQVTTNIVLTDVGTLVSVPINATISSGSNLLVEVGYVAQEAGSGNLIFLSANNLGQTAPTYISSTACGIANPVTMASINFPNAHLVLTVTGSILSLNDNLSQQVSVYPNPSSGNFTIELPSNVTIEKANLIDVLGKQFSINIDSNNSFSISNLNSGMYILNIETSEGVLNKRIIKK